MVIKSAVFTELELPSRLQDNWCSLCVLPRSVRSVCVFVFQPNAVVEACALLTVRGDETTVYRVNLMAHTDTNTAT